MLLSCSECTLSNGFEIPSLKSLLKITLHETALWRFHCLSPVPCWWGIGPPLSTGRACHMFASDRHEEKEGAVFARLDPRVQRPADSQGKGGGVPRYVRLLHSVHASRALLALSFAPQATSPNENPLYFMDHRPAPASVRSEASEARPDAEEAPKPRRPTWLALPTRSVSTDSGGGTTSSTLTPGPPGSHVSPMSEGASTPLFTEPSQEPSAPPAVTALAAVEEMDTNPAVAPARELHLPERRPISLSKLLAA